MRQVLRTIAGTAVSALRASGILFAAVDAWEAITDEYHDHVKTAYYERQIRRTADAVGDGLWVGGESRVNSNTVLGENVLFFGMVISGEGRVRIGDNFRSGSGCVILTENHDYDTGDALPYGDDVIAEAVTIEDNVWLGIDVTVLPGVSIGEGAIIQAGSVVTDDIPAGAIAGGHPAEVFGHRDMDHYDRLKARDAFN